MDNQGRYIDLLERLTKHSYIVFLDEQGFVVQHLTDEKDISRIRTISELIDLVELIEWREQRKSKTSSV